MNDRNAPALSRPRQMQLQWPSLRVESVWLPPFRGHAVNQPNRVEVVFSAHTDMALELLGRVHTVDVEPGAMFVVGNEPTSLLSVREYSDTLEMYPDMALLRSCAERHGLRHFSLQPSLGVGERATFRRDPVVLAVAHVLRRACMGQLSVSDIEADTMAHLLAQRVVLMQHGIDDRASAAPAPRLNALSIAKRRLQLHSTGADRVYERGRLAGVDRRQSHGDVPDAEVLRAGHAATPEQHHHWMSLAALFSQRDQPRAPRAEFRGETSLKRDQRRFDVCISALLFDVTRRVHRGSERQTGQPRR